MARLSLDQRVHVERVKRAKRVTITIDDGDTLTLGFTGDTKRMCHEIALAIQQYFSAENDKIIARV